jgi:pimeloyl-ACP methyl ester carboxylesterase
MWYYLIGLVAFILLLALTGFIYESVVRANDRKRYPPPGKLVEVGSYKLHLFCAGEHRPGQSTVVLESGMGSWSFFWRLVQPEVAKFSRVCSYDRAGFGWSEPGSKPRTSQQIATELHTLLVNAGETGPYVLVGHSLGGVFVRQYSRQYPEEVAGMVLVDSGHEDQMERFPPEERKRFESYLHLFRVLSLLAQVGVIRVLGHSLLLPRFPSVRTPEDQAILLASVSNSTYYDTTRDESLAMLRPTNQERSPTPLGDRPLIVVQASGRPETLPRGYSMERWERQRQALDDIQKELAGLSSNGRLIVAEKSLHNVQAEQPEIVIEAIRQVVGTVQA